MKYDVRVAEHTNPFPYGPEKQKDKNFRALVIDTSLNALYLFCRSTRHLYWYHKGCTF